MKNFKHQRNSIALPFVDHFATLSISPFGRDMTIAGRNGIWIIDLEDENPSASAFTLSVLSQFSTGLVPLYPPAVFHHPINTLAHSAAINNDETVNYAGVRCEWHTFRSHGEYIASSIGCKVQLWNIKQPSSPATLQPVRAFPAHQRCITDIEWSLSDPNVLASCSLDSFVNLWDIRVDNSCSLGKSAHSFYGDRYAATSMCWNRKNEFILASAHDRFVFIWDVRFGALPVRKLESKSNVLSIDWSHVNENELLIHASSQPIEIYNSQICERKSQLSLKFNKTRFTPFGSGVIGAAETLSFRSVNDIDNEVENVSMNSPVVDENLITEFAWRVSRGVYEQNVDERVFKLLTWGNDCILREFRFDSKLFSDLGHRRDATDVKEDLIPESVIHDYVHELMVSARIQNNQRNKLGEYNHRSKTRIWARKTVKKKILYGNASLYSLVPRDSVNISQEDVEDHHEYPRKSVFGKNEERLFVDLRARGAWFSGDRLLCFHVTKQDASKKLYDMKIPDSNGNGVPSVAAVVVNVDHMLPYRIFKDIFHGAEKYLKTTPESKLLQTIDQNLKYLLQNNQQKGFSTFDINVWTLCRMIVEIWSSITGKIDFEKTRSLWGNHPFGIPMLNFLADSMIKTSNVPMFTMIAVFITKLNAAKEFEPGNSNMSIPKFLSIFENPTSPETAGNFKRPDIKSISTEKTKKLMMKGKLKNIPISLRHKIQQSEKEPISQFPSIQQPKYALFESKWDDIFLTHSISQFQELLLRWQMFHLNAEFQKFLDSQNFSKLKRSNSDVNSKGPHFNILCQHCGMMLRESGVCDNCRRFASECVICNLPARGLAMFCRKCGHGGHVEHIKNWFSGGSVHCATGCGCECKTSEFE